MPTNVYEPVPGPNAFRAEGDAAVQSQAAILIATGRQLRGDDAALAARAEAAGLADRVEGFLPEDVEEGFPLPRVRPTPAQFDPARVADAMPADLAEAATAPQPFGVAGGDEFRAQVAEQLYADSSPETAAVLLQSSLAHPDELVRVSAAASYLEVAPDPVPLLHVLEAGLNSRDELVRDVAATGLGRFAPEDRALAALTGDPIDTTRFAAPESAEGLDNAAGGVAVGPGALIVHGTWAKSGRWWRPGGDFHTFVRAFRPELYSASDRFDWSGAYSDGARRLGGRQLLDWVSARGMGGLDLYTHSHGGSISMLANQNGMDIGCLVLMSCPVHVHRYFPAFNRIRKGVVSVRVKMDLVILLDGGGQRYRDPRIREHVLPIWFNHSASHEPAVWSRHNVADTIECGGRRGA
jgi:hypothetical protein